MNYVKKNADIQKNKDIAEEVAEYFYSEKPLKFLFFFRSNQFLQNKKESAALLLLPYLFRKNAYLHKLIHYSTGVGLAGSKMSLASNKSDKRL